MKKLCRAVLLFLTLSIGCQGLYAQEKLSTKRVNFETGKATASEAVGKFLSENVKDRIYSEDDLKGYTVQPTKCKNELLLDCLNKILKDIPVETLIDNNSIIIRQKKNKPTSNITANSSLTLAKKDTISESSDIHTIDEITLNAGYYKVNKKEQTGSIAKVSAKDIENQPVSNVLSTIQGRMTGVNITQNSGVPGAGFEIQIRGQNSLRTGSFTEQNGNVPLYVVDGVPFTEISPQKSQISSTIIPGGNINPLNTINPNDIESIEVLKDADATAIYGSRGANGVILITTKKGKTGKVRLNFSTNYGVSEAISNLTLLNKDEYLNMRRTAYKNDGIATYPSNAYDVNGVWDQQNGIDWQKVLIGKKATMSNTQLSANGGSKTTSFLLGLGHNEQTTVYGQDFKYTSNNFSSNLSHRSEDNRFQINVSNLFTQQKNNVIYSDLTAKTFTLAPVSPQLYNADGSLNWANNTFTNPLAAYNASYNNDTKLFQTNLNSEYKLFKDFKIKINAGLNYTIINELALQPNTIYNPNIASGLSSANSQARQKKQDIFSFIVEPQVNWTKGWGNHNLQLLVGGTFQNIIRDTEEELGFGFESNQFISNIAAAKTVMMLENSNIEYKYAAMYGRLNYQFKNKYILNLTGRRDGSSRFGPNNRFANFGAVGAAWNFSRENLFKNLSWLSAGKIRASYGSAGSDNIGDFQFLNNYIVSSSLIYNNITGLSPSRLYNPDYSWEITKKLETAVELGFFKNRLNLSTSLYRNRSSSQLVGYQLSAVTGFSSVMANLNATIENKGLEIEITGRPLSKKELQWESSFNISFPRNKLLSFPGLAGSSYANQYVIGQPTNIVKLYQFEGIDPSTGQYKFKDFNGDGKITSPEDRQVVADIGVKYFGGWSNSFHYKNWDLSVHLQFVKKRGWNYNSIMSLPGTMSNQPTQILDVWSPENPSGHYMPYSTLNTNTHNLFRTSTAAVSDASFIRLKNIQLGYTLPLTEGVFRDVKIYFQGQNLWTWTKFFGVDPEALTSGFLPPLRTYSFGIQFNL